MRACEGCGFPEYILQSLVIHSTAKVLYNVRSHIQTQRHIQGSVARNSRRDGKIRWIWKDLAEQHQSLRRLFIGSTQDRSQWRWMVVETTGSVKEWMNESITVKLIIGWVAAAQYEHQMWVDLSKWRSLQFLAEYFNDGFKQLILPADPVLFSFFFVLTF